MKLRREMIVGIMSTLLILSMLTLAFRILPTKAESKIWTVPVDFGTIQEAISSEEVSSGDTIYVYTGTYYESLIVNKMLTLVGESRSGTIIDGSISGNVSALVRITTDNVDMSGFTVRNAEVGAGILCDDSWGCDIYETIVCFTGDRGIVFEGGGCNKAYSNIVYNSSVYGGIEAIWSNNNSIYNNIAYFNQWGIATNHGSFNLIYNNTVYSNRGTGIHIDWPSTDNMIYNNDVTSNTNASIGVMNRANRTVISGNTVSGSFCGIHFENSFANSISGNDITNNAVGVLFSLSENNTIYHNNFINNSNQVYINPSMFNIWDDGYPSGGNCWSDYMGVDFHRGPHQNETGSDGIGDIPYTIDGNNTDRYPVIEPWQAPIIIGTTAKITFLDPAKAYDDRTWEVFNNIEEGLLKYKPGTTDITYGIAENYTVSPDGFNYTFKLREGMFFTDGEPLDAEAVRWSIERVARFGLDPSWLVSDFVDRVEVLGTLTVRFILKKPIAFFPALVTTTPYFPVSSKSYPANETAEPTTGHYGPYKIKNWIRDVELVLEANSGYYGVQPKSKYVVVRSFTNSTMMRKALENGEIDVAWKTLSLPDTVALKENSNFNVFENREAIIRSIVLRCNMAPFDDVRLRQAVAAAINRTRVCVQAFMGTVDPLYSLVPMGMWSHIDSFLDEYGVRNLTLARELLTTAGYGESEKFIFELWHTSYYADAATVIKSDLEETGMINVTLIGASPGTILENIPEGVMQAFLIGWFSDYLDPDAYLTQLVHSERSPDIGAFYNSTVMDAILDEAMVEPSMMVRTELYEAAQRLLAEDAPLVPFSQGAIYAVTRPNIEGVYLSPTTLLPYYTIYKHVPSTRYSWPMFHHDLSHTGYSESPAPNTNQILWNYTTGWLVYSSPAVADGKVYVGSYDNKTYCLDALSGAHIWDYTTGGYVFSSPAVVDGKVYVGSPDGKVYCLDASTGSHIWNYTIWLPVSSSPAVVDGKVYVGSPDGKVYCLDASTGSHIWNYTTGANVESSPAVADGKVYVGSHDNKVYCLDASTGSHIWNYTTGWLVYSSPAVADGKVYVGSYDNKTYCLDAATGALVWSYTTGDWMFSSPAVADGMVFVGSCDGKVYAFGNVVRVTEKIQEAIDDASAGATLIIAPGIYYESIVINKPLTILGEKGSAPIFGGGGSGIFATILSTASGSTIAGIVITNWNQGILINDATNCKIYDNIMSLMGTCGIGVEGTNAVNNQIYSNIFQDNTVAIDLLASSATNTIYKNIITSNIVGLTLKSSGNTIYANTICENDVGIDVSNSHDNVIYHNNFANYVENAIGGGAYNVWDNGYPSGGNYWSDYTGLDEKNGPGQDVLGSDGIGDTEYAIATNNIDNYPLMQPFNHHDIGVVNVILSKTVVGQGFRLRLELKILNYGIYDETFTVTAYANGMAIATQTITLASRNCMCVPFIWETAGVPKGYYTISAYARPVMGETDTADNTLPGGQIRVVTQGNVNGDGIVNMVDIYSELILRFLCRPGDSGYRPNSDINDDAVINYQDIYIAILHFMETEP